MQDTIISGSKNMAIQTRSLVILLFLLAAIVFYAAGFHTGLFALVAVGGIFELLFWARLFRKRR